MSGSKGCWPKGDGGIGQGSGEFSWAWIGLEIGFVWVCFSLSLRSGSFS